MFKKLIIRITQALRRNQIPYMIIGGQAVLYYGEPRFTKDIDITLGADVNELERVTALIVDLGLKILPADVRTFVKQTMVLPALDISSRIRIDFIFSHSLYERQAMSRAKHVKLGRGMIRIASLEDLVIHKIISGRARDIEDIKVLILKNPEYDSVYVRRWLKRFDQTLKQKYLKAFNRLAEEAK